MSTVCLLLYAVLRCVRRQVYTLLMPMRLPDEFRNCVVFLGTRDRDDRVQYRGTAFLIGVKARGRENLYHVYLATAAHNVRRAQNDVSPLFTRWNTNDNSALVVETTTNWFFHPDEAVDLAVLPVDPPKHYQIGLIPAETFVTDSLLAEHDFGIGDEIMAIGLFYFRHGRKRNLPVLRSGIVASMPDEPFEDETTGLPFDAYIIEMRSFGGLSGTPVFTVIHHGSLVDRPGRVFSLLVHQLALVGVIRSHWDLKVRRDVSYTDDIEQANLGLTMVTPAQKFTELLMVPDLVRLRAKEAESLPAEDDPS